jgi:uncharacterized protein
MSPVRSVDEWKVVLRAALGAARRARRTHALAAIRGTLAAIDNAEAADPSLAPPVQPGVIAGGVAGLGAGEVPRRVLTPQAVAEIVAREIRERQEAAAAYSALGRPDEAETLRLEVEVLASLL